MSRRCWKSKTPSAAHLAPVFGQGFLWARTASVRRSRLMIARSAASAPTWLLPFPASKSSRCHCRVPDRRLDAAVAEISLQRAGILALVGVLETAAMAEHVRMNQKRHASPLAEPSHHLAKPCRRDRAAAL